MYIFQYLYIHNVQLLPILMLHHSSKTKVSIYSATEDFRHGSIPTAIQALQSKGPSPDIQFETTEDKAQFTDQYLAQYDALLFLDNIGEGEFHDL